MASSITPIRRTRAGWTASGACTSGSTARRADATRPASGGAAATSTAGAESALERLDARLGGALEQGVDVGAVVGIDRVADAQLDAVLRRIDGFARAAVERGQEHRDVAVGLRNQRKEEIALRTRQHVEVAQSRAQRPRD